MAEDVWTTGILTPVYQVAGRNPDNSVRFRRAPFDLLTWQSTSGGAPDTYVNTLGFETTNSAALALLDDHDAITVSQEFGWYRLNPVVVEPHQGNGRDDTWVALHSFGYL